MADPTDAERFIASEGRGDPQAVASYFRGLREATVTALPGVVVPWPRLIRELAARTAQRDLQAVNTDAAVELALACACVEQDPRALSHFEQHYAAVVPRALAHMKLDPSVVEDVTQLVRTKLLVADADGEIKLVRYAGGGSLRGLVKVTAVRTAISELRKRGARDQPAAELDRLAEQTDDPELGFLKAHYRQAFAEAFEQAVTALDRRERNVLRMHLIGAMTLEEVARMYGVNRSTIVRTLQRARARLLSETRKVMRERLAVGGTELDSVVALIRSRLDVSVGRMLQTSPPEPE